MSTSKIRFFALLLALLLLPGPAAVAGGAWREAGSLNQARGGHTATLLNNGLVLVVGGADAGCRAELYNPATGTWTFTGAQSFDFSYHTATLLADGRVLVVGGQYGGAPLQSAWIFEPATEEWTSAGNLNLGRYNHTATRLPDGRVLVVGGEGEFFPEGVSELTAEIYDPGSGAWTIIDLPNPRVKHGATLLPNGTVLLAGGIYDVAVDLFDPATGEFSNTGPLSQPRAYHTATLLANGKVLLAGGWGADGFIAAAELYDPATGEWSSTGPLNQGRDSHTAVLLPDRKVLVAGGWSLVEGSWDIAGSAELYDPGSETWSFVNRLNEARVEHAAVLLNNGEVLVAGGLGLTGYIDGAEVFSWPKGNLTGIINLLLLDK
jgi:N-acetylneuraminic acid mutarotase